VIEIKVLGGNDADILKYVAPDVFDDRINPHVTDAFLRDPRHHLAVAVEDNVVVVLCPQSTMFIQTSHARSFGSTRLA
jgi:hypothetical protein